MLFRSVSQSRYSLAEDGFTELNVISTFGAVLLAVSMIPFFWNVWITYRYGAKVELKDPWGYGRSLKWATESPFPRHNFHSIPRIRSESPAFDLNHPEFAAPEAKAAYREEGRI